MYWSKINHTRCSKENKVLDTLSIVELDTVVLNFKKNSKCFLWERSCIFTESCQKIWFLEIALFSQIFCPLCEYWVYGMGWEGEGFSFLPLLIVENFADESALACFIAIDFSRRETKFSDQTLAPDQLWQTLQGPNISAQTFNWE